jgi:hypothetical protein
VKEAVEELLGVYLLHSVTPIVTMENLVVHHLPSVVGQPRCFLPPSAKVPRASFVLTFWDASDPRSRTATRRIRARDSPTSGH